MGSSPCQLLPGDVTGALREAILLPRLPGESATAPSHCLATPATLPKTSHSLTFRAGREAADMGTRDDEYDYLFKGGSPDQPNFKSCVQQHLSATPVPLSSVNLKTWQLLRIKFNNNCATFFVSQIKVEQGGQWGFEIYRR